MLDALLIGAILTAAIWLAIRWDDRGRPNPKPGPAGLALGLATFYIPSSLLVWGLFSLFGWW